MFEFNFKDSFLLVLFNTLISGLYSEDSPSGLNTPPELLETNFPILTYDL